MAKSTKNTYLMYKAGEATDYTKLVDIIDYPDLQEPKNEVDATTLSDTTKQFVEGVRENAQKEFNVNFNATDYATLEALDGKLVELAIYFDTTTPTAEPVGDYAKFIFSGYVTVSVTGGAVDELTKMKVNVTMATPVTIATV